MSCLGGQVGPVNHHNCAPRAALFYTRQTSIAIMLVLPAPYRKESCVGQRSPVAKPRQNEDSRPQPSDPRNMCSSGKFCQLLVLEQFHAAPVPTERCLSTETVLSQGQRILTQKIGKVFFGRNIPAP